MGHKNVLIKRCTAKTLHENSVFLRKHEEIKKIYPKGLKTKNQTPFFQNKETGDASKRQIAGHLPPWCRIGARGVKE